MPPKSKVVAKQAEKMIDDKCVGIHPAAPHQSLLERVPAAVGESAWRTGSAQDTGRARALAIPVVTHSPQL